MRADLLLLVVFVALVLDSRRLHALARSTVRVRRASGAGRGIPAGADPDRVGLTLRDIQMRLNIDWQDGGIGWDGPEILPVDESDELVYDQCDDEPVDRAPADPEPDPSTEPGRALPVLWQPFPALLPAGATGGWAKEKTPATTAA